MQAAHLLPMTVVKALAFNSEEWVVHWSRLFLQEVEQVVMKAKEPEQNTV